MKKLLLSVLAFLIIGNVCYLTFKSSDNNQSFDYSTVPAEHIAAAGYDSREEFMVDVNHAETLCNTGTYSNGIALSTQNKEKACLAVELFRSYAK